MTGATTKAASPIQATPAGQVQPCLGGLCRFWILATNADLTAI
jgi:hypothetical protein